MALIRLKVCFFIYISDFFYYLGLLICLAEFLVQNIDGRTLLDLNEVALSEFGIGNTIIRKRFLRHLQVLKKRNLNFLKSRSLDELDEYVLFLESHRIKVW